MHLVTRDPRIASGRLYLQSISPHGFFGGDSGVERSGVMMPQQHWRVLLDGYGERDTGDVITRDGEVIGTWSLVEDVFYTFTPDGADEHIFFVPHLGSCARS
jgi:hypothetical protein